MELLTINTSVLGKECYGGKKHEKDIMLSISSDMVDITDIFLTKKQAKLLVTQLKTKLKQNKGS